MPFHKSMTRLAHLINGVAFIVGCFAALTALQTIEYRFFPVKDLKVISTIEVRGQDVWITGEFRKLRSSCRYIHPVRGTDLTTGANLYIVSHNRTAGQNWQKTDIALDYGPWQIVGAAGKKLQLYQEYDCHPLWVQFDPLFEIDATDPSNLTYKVL